MADGPDSMVSLLLHELAERLQSAGSYVKVASRIVSHNASDQAATAEIMEKAADELQRAQTAFHGLREHLAADERRPRGASGIDGESRTEIRHA
ncbi:MAG: hypothetical protein ACLQUZ_14180 [Rhizomicrobium sp.]